MLCGRRRLLCPLPLIALTLLALGAAARGAPVMPAKLVEVKDPNAQSTTLLLDDATAEQTWTLAWSDLGVTDGDAPPAGAGSFESFAGVNDTPAQAPAVIAAPLPPALLPGLIGLAGVYAYKRGRRLR